MRALAYVHLSPSFALAMQKYPVRETNANAHVVVSNLQFVLDCNTQIPLVCVGNDVFKRILLSRLNKVAIRPIHIFNATLLPIIH